MPGIAPLTRSSGRRAPRLEAAGVKKDTSSEAHSSTTPVEVKSWRCGRQLSYEQRENKRKRDRESKRDERELHRKLVKKVGDLETQACQVAVDLQQRTEKTSQLLRIITDLTRGNKQLKAQLHRYAVMEGQPPIDNDDAFVTSAGQSSVQLFAQSNCAFQRTDGRTGISEPSQATPWTHYLLSTDWIRGSFGEEPVLTSEYNHAMTQAFSSNAAFEINTALRPCCLSEPCGSVVPMRRVQVDGATLFDCSVELIQGRATNLDPEGYAISDLLNWAFTLPLMVPHERVCSDDGTNQEIILRAVFGGWGPALERGPICPLWGLLRLIDDHCYWCAGPVNRLALLRTTHKMLLVQTGLKSIESLPRWYRPRLLQYERPHEVIVRYWPWPLLRERCIESLERVLNNRLWVDFAEGFKFDWPYDSFESSCTLDLQTGRPQFTRRFLELIDDIGRFTCSKQFFRKHSELYSDMGPGSSLLL